MYSKRDLYKFFMQKKPLDLAGKERYLKGADELSKLLDPMDWVMLCFYREVYLDAVAADRSVKAATEELQELIDELFCDHIREND